MAESLFHQIEAQVAKAPQLYHRVVIVVGLARSGKTSALQKLEAQHGWPVPGDEVVGGVAATRPGLALWFRGNKNG